MLKWVVSLKTTKTKHPEVKWNLGGSKLKSSDSPIIGRSDWLRTAEGSGKDQYTEYSFESWLIKNNTYKATEDAA